tara:strand:+ start:1060 stop:1977 length:918 start_codon:yes stop_codon:yes gene_type:complete
MNYLANRRRFIKHSTILALGSALSRHSLASNTLKRIIPSSGEMLPVIGMGSSRTFDVQLTATLRTQLKQVLSIFFSSGGALVDSSPMYGLAEMVLGTLHPSVQGSSQMFGATKVWTEGKNEGIAQMQQSMERMAVTAFDLIQVHNLVDWKTQLSTLQNWKGKNKVRYIGITTSHRQKHNEVEAVMRNEAIDFVQFSYNIENRQAEERLLPLAQERGIATLINRPYQMGKLFKKSKNKALPDLAQELNCESWGQFYLKFILAHPAVTCLIPATAKPSHMRDNMGAGFGAVPGTRQREEMLRIYHSL